MCHLPPATIHLPHAHCGQSGQPPGPIISVPSSPGGPSSSATWQAAVVYVTERGARIQETRNPGSATHQLGGLRRAFLPPRASVSLTVNKGNNSGLQESPSPGPGPLKCIRSWADLTAGPVWSSSMGGTRPAGFATTMDGAHMPTAWWPPLSWTSAWSCHLGWDSTAGHLTSYSYTHRVTIADDTVMLALWRWTVMGSATGPGCLGAGQCQGPGKAERCRPVRGNDPDSNSHCLL